MTLRHGHVAQHEIKASRAMAPVLAGMLVAAVLQVVSGVAATPARAATGDIGIEGASFAPFAGTSTPTAAKPESKLWWAQGSWWASMASTVTQGYRIMRLDRTDEQWVDTGVDLDPRGNTQADALWNGTHLFVASHVISSSSTTAVSGAPARLYRYSPSGSSWALDSGFPVAISDYSAEALTIAQDSTGRIWATFTRSKRLYTAVSKGSGDAGSVSFGSAFIPSFTNYSSADSKVANTLTADDISAVASANGTTTIVWSNQAADTTYAARHVDGAATTTWAATKIVSGPDMSDDHINVQVLPGDAQGRVFATLKTSLNDAASSKPSDPLLVVAVYTPASGSWSTVPLSTVAESGTRPILVIDTAANTLNAYYTGPTKAGSIAFQGTIYRKSSPLGSPSFAPGVGTPVLRDASSATMNNATTSKQPVDTSSGTVLIARPRGRCSTGTPTPSPVRRRSSRRRRRSRRR